MYILNVDNLTKEFSGQVLFERISFGVNDKDKIGLVGINGCGKTTLFNILTGVDDDYTGTVSSKSIRIGYMQQHIVSGDSTAYEELLGVFGGVISLERELAQTAARLNENADEKLIEKQQEMLERFEHIGGLTYKSRARAALSGFQFSEEEQNLPISALSGGQRSKISLAKLLLSDADLMLLDEPTNHLDIASASYVEEFLQNHQKAAIVISHDRFFLDRVAHRIFEIENRKLFTFDGNYSNYIEYKKERQQLAVKHYNEQKREIARIEGIIKQQRQWNRERNIRMAESREKQVEKLKRKLQTPDREEQAVTFQFSADRQSGGDVLQVDDLSVSFDRKMLFSHIHMDIKKGDRAVIIGKNGCGKTTLLRRILGRSPSIRFGTGVKTAYFDQNQAMVNNGHTILEEVSSHFRNMSNTELRNALAAFSFRGDDVFKRVGLLSGGEKARVSLLKLMLSGANLLVMDEPTNHLDVASREAMENALSLYDGTLLMVSHDRYFINKLATKIYDLDDSARLYTGNYDYYLEKKPLLSDSAETHQKNPGAGGQKYKEKKEYASALRKLTSRIAKCEEEIERVSSEIKEITTQLHDEKTATDYKAAMELNEKLDTLTRSEREAMDLWEALGIQLQEMKEDVVL